MKPERGVPRADLIERVVRGEATDAERARVSAWRQESAQNEREFRRIERLLGAARGLGVTGEPAPVRPSAAVIIDAARRRRARWRYRIGWTAAAAAAIAVLAVQLGGRASPTAGSRRRS